VKIYTIIVDGCNQQVDRPNMTALISVVFCLIFNFWFKNLAALSVGLAN